MKIYYKKEPFLWNIRQIFFCCSKMAELFFTKDRYSIGSRCSTEGIILKYGDIIINFCPFCGAKIETILTGDN